VRHVTKNRTVICSVVFVDVADYSQMSVARQARVKEVLNHVISTAIERIPDDERFVLDTGDGAALGFVGDPEDALFVAIDILGDFHDSQTDDAQAGLRVGINLGPVRVAEDISGRMNLIGDGINVAQRIMSFAQPNQMLVSRSYFEVVSCLSARHAALFRYHGLHKDKHVREHVVYEVNASGEFEPEIVAAPPQTGPVAISPEKLAAIQRHLARVIGPLSSIIVPRAAERCNSEAAFVETLALTVPAGPEREQFLAEFGVSRPTEVAPEIKEPGLPATAAPWTEHELDEVTRALARQVGPLAKVLTGRAAVHSGSLDGLITSLSTEIPDGEHRASFLADTRSLLARQSGR
jgi:class 3 adenylate cyclase